MATVTVTTQSAGVLPPYFMAGSYVASNSFGDPFNSTYLSYVTDIPFEVLRTSVSTGNVKIPSSFDDDPVSDWRGTDTNWGRVKKLYQELWGRYGTKWQPILYAFPATVIASGTVASAVGNVSGTSDGHSPLAHVAWIKKWQTIFGANSVVGWEPYNEPAGEMLDVWCTPSNAATARDWAAIWQRAYWTEKAADPATSPLKMYGFSYSKGGETNSEEQNEINRFLTGSGISGWPGGTNTDYCDGLTAHLYLTSSATIYTDQQSMLNSTTYPTFTTNKGGFQAAFTQWRSTIGTYDTSTSLSMTEMYPSAVSQAHSNDPDGALEEVARAIVAARNQAAWKLDTYMVGHALNAQQYTGGANPTWVSLTNATGTAAPPEDGMVLASGSSTFQGRNVKAQAIIDLIAPLLTQAKTMVSTTVASSGTTPASAASNSVDRILCQAGVSSDGNTMQILLANIDLGTGESVTLNFPPSVGSVTGKKLTQTMICGDACGTVSGLPTAYGSTSTTFTAGAGEAYLITVPIRQPRTGPLRRVRRR